MPFWLGVGGDRRWGDGFLLHQLMAWAPHEDETLALFVGRDSLAGVVEHVTRERGGAPLHFLFAYAVAHLGARPRQPAPRLGRVRGGEPPARRAARPAARRPLRRR